MPAASGTDPDAAFHTATRLPSPVRGRPARRAFRVPLGRVTPKALTQSLRGLERNGFVSRTVHADPKLRVEYALTPLGRSTLEPLAAACRWASEHWDELLDAREGGISSIG
ncbi:winged helix-turn-helix transcriptional regulator [Streptomyces sp. DH10]|uniref:winged helix-turn-helix transcriptional regulator n=1 Tax=Streptomyces sp. DH10 TaxID=3040121 RepID=UPI003FA69495